jgi:formylglycine-generating enzyme
MPNSTSFFQNIKVSFILVSLSFICIQKSFSQEHHQAHCSLTDSIVGKEFLSSEFLTVIKTIPTDSKHQKSTKGMVLIKGGTFEMGGDQPVGFENMPQTALAQPDEFPKHTVKVSDFYMDETEVTVGHYLEFVKATGYKTVAERDIDWEQLKKQLPNNTPKPSDEMLKAGALVFHYVPKATATDDLGNWWKFTIGANWKNPDGTHPKLESLLDYPVTQISWYDAMAYAKWKGKRLPTEAEFEYALRSKLQNNMYPWGNETIDKNIKRGNFLQGEFPYHNTADDGYSMVAPVKSFPPNAYGLYDLAGNVWEWTSDWYSAIYYNELSEKKTIAINPKGPEKSFEVFDPKAVNKSVRGGSFLCNDNWCSGYRNSRRMRLSPDTGMQHLGFRLVSDAPTN